MSTIEMIGATEGKTENGSLNPSWFVALDCCICLLHSMHIALVFVITVYLVSVAGIGSDPLQLNLCILLLQK